MPYAATAIIDWYGDMNYKMPNWYLCYVVRYINEATLEEQREQYEVFDAMDTNDDYVVTEEEYIAYAGDSAEALDTFEKLDRYWGKDDGNIHFFYTRY